MKHFSWKSIYPHLLAIGIFLLITIIYCKPALESDVTLVQSDITSVNGMSHQLTEHEKATGKAPLWCANMFSGMPAFQIVYPLPYNPVAYVGTVLQLGLPKPFNFFFLACICFYILCMCIRLRPYIAIVGSLAFAYCTYDPILVGAGHDTKFLAMAYMPALLGSVILIYNKKYISGLILTALFTCLELMQNHQQIAYYIVIVIGIMTVSYIVSWVKEKQFKPMLIGLALALLGGIIGVLGNSTNLFTVADYAKETKRGGVLDMSKPGKATKTEGLTEEYAFQWSYGRMETFSLMFPGVQGYGLHFAQRDGDSYLFPKLDENSKTAQYFVEKLNVGEDQAANIASQVSSSIYWGPQPFTNGPVYLGAVVCFLFILSLFIVDKKYTYWIAAACILTILMSWGANFAAFNNFLFKNLPFYNKFRVPTIILVVPQLLFALSATLAIDKMVTVTDTKALWQQIKKGLIATGAVFAVVTLFYITSDFSKENTQRTSAFNALIKSNPADMQNAMRELNNKFKPETDNQLYENFMFNTKGNEEVSKGVVHALRQDRSSLLGKDILTSLVYVLLAFALIYGFIEKKINATVLIAGLGIVTMIDLLVIDSKYLNDKNYTVKDRYEEDNFPMTPVDQAILKDKDPNYRIFNMAKGSDPFQDANPSYYHKSIGGYHPAKLGIYDDLITYQLSGKMNLPVLNMLNTKYIIQPGQDGNAMPTQNPGALGNVWFVKGVHWANGPAEEMLALDNFSPKDTAVMDSKYKPAVDGKFTADSAATIQQTKFDNDAITYESNSTTPQLAVFSEIYYKDWAAYIDGKPTDILKANYVLRSLVVPAGKHIIDFKFEPKIYHRTFVISTIAGWLMLLAFLGWLFKEIIAVTKTAQKQ